MTLFHQIRRKRYTASKLYVIVFAWLNLLASPCALAFLQDGQPHETKGGSDVHEHSHELKAGGEVHEHSHELKAGGEVHEHSPNQSANPTLEDHCCGDRSGFIKADLLKPFKSISLLSLPFGHLQVESVLLSDTQKFNRILPVHITSPSVYLSTQRVRI